MLYVISNHQDRTKWTQLAEVFQQVTGKQLDPAELNEKMVELYKKFMVITSDSEDSDVGLNP
jgi:hypothetical protein